MARFSAFEKAFNDFFASVLIEPEGQKPSVPFPAGSFSNLMSNTAYGQTKFFRAFESFSDELDTKPLRKFVKHFDYGSKHSKAERVIPLVIVMWFVSEVTKYWHNRTDEEPEPGFLMHAPELYDFLKYLRELFMRQPLELRQIAEELVIDFNDYVTDRLRIAADHKLTLDFPKLSGITIPSLADQIQTFEDDLPTSKSDDQGLELVDFNSEPGTVEYRVVIGDRPKRHPLLHMGEQEKPESFATLLDALNYIRTLRGSASLYALVHGYMNGESLCLPIDITGGN